MLTSPKQYERARREVARLEKLVKAGTATEEDKRRAMAGAEELVAYEWAEEGKRWREQRGTTAWTPNRRSAA
jgi:hypothetical protein